MKIHHLYKNMKKILTGEISDEDEDKLMWEPGTNEDIK